jgi:hypothetical protein
VCIYYLYTSSQNTAISDGCNLLKSTTCFGPLFNGPSSGCPWNSQINYTLVVVVFGGGEGMRSRLASLCS